MHSSATPGGAARFILISSCCRTYEGRGLEFCRIRAGQHRWLRCSLACFLMARRSGGGNAAILAVIYTLAAKALPYGHGLLPIVQAISDVFNVRGSHFSKQTCSGVKLAVFAFVFLHARRMAVICCDRSLAYFLGKNSGRLADRLT